MHEICSNCKTKLIDFFIFKRKNEEARKIFRESSVFENGAVKNMLLEVVDQIDNNMEESQEEICKSEKETHEDSILESIEDDEAEMIDNDNEDFIVARQINHSDDDLNVKTEEVIETVENDESNFDENSQDDLSFDKTELESASRKRKTVRQSNPENWLRNKRKLAKNSGQSYYASNGKFVQAKEMKCNCGETCRMQCSKKVNETHRMENFNHFYSLGDIEKQRKFLFEHMKTFEPKRKQTPSNCQKVRAVQRSYFLDIIHDDGVVQMIQVCKLMFLNTFAISSQMIDTLYRKAMTQGQFNDVRGKFERKSCKRESLDVTSCE